MSSLQAVNAFATSGVRPDLTLLLSVPLDMAQARQQARGESDRMEQEDLAFHQRVRAAFDMALTAEWQGEHPEVGPVVAIGADMPVDVVTVRCLEALVARWPERFTTAASAALAAI
jgi:dTMP kinase